MVCQLATQFKMSSCHHASQGVERSISDDGVAARFTGVQRVIWAGYGGLGVWFRICPNQRRLNKGPHGCLGLLLLFLALGGDALQS